MTRSLSVLPLLVLSSCAMLPRPGKPSMPDVQFRMRDFRLANGMRIIVEEDHASPLVGVFTVVGVGSSGDPKGKEGLAHLIEHLAFRATPGNRDTAWNQLEAAGIGNLNAMTNLDNTLYYEVGSKDLLPKLLAIDAARLTNPLLGVDEKQFNVEREVVRNELRQRGENAIGPAFNFLQEAVFPPSHHYSRPIGGSHESLTAISFDDAKAFASTFYKPPNMTMVIVGDVDLARVHETLFRALPPGFFQPLPPTKEPWPSRLAAEPPALPEPPPTKLIRRNSTVASPELYVVWSLPRSFDADTILLDFVRAAASRELGAAFFSDPDIVNVGVFPVPGVEASMLVAQASLRKGEHPEKSLERLLDQLVNIWATTEENAETQSVVEADKAFGRSRNAAVMEMTFGAENIAERGMERAQSAHFTGDPLTYSRRLKALIDVNQAQVSRFAEKYLKRDRARAVLVEPFPPDSKNAGAGPTGLTPAEASAMTASFTPEAVKELGQSMQAHGLETIVRAARDHIVETLPNGLKVVVHRRRNSLPVVAVELTFTAGTATSTPAGAADLGEQVAAPKAHTYGRASDYGIRWSTSIGGDRSSISGSGASGNVSNMIAQLSDRVTSMHVETAQLEFFKTEFAEYMEKAEQLPQLKSERALRAALFPGHPFGTSATVAEQRKLSGSDIEGWFDKAWSPKNAVLVVTGDINAEKTFEDVKRFLGGWKGAEAPLSVAPPPLRSDAAPAIVITHQANASQAQFHMACLADGAREEQELANKTVANLLGTALFEKVRGELGASYGIHGRASTMVGGTGRLDWNGAIENNRLGQALGVIRAMTSELERSFTDQAVGRARWEVARESTMLDSSSDIVASVLTHQVLMGRKPEESVNLFDKLAGVGRPQLEAAWRQCKGTTVISLTGDEARIKQALKDAGY